MSAVQAYAGAVIGFREFIRALEADRDPFGGRINIVRAVQDLVDIARRNPGLLLDVLYARPEHAEPISKLGGYAASHAAGTCAFSLLIGASMQLKREELLDLGTSALLSKVAFALLPPELTEQPGELSAEQLTQIRLAMIRATQRLIAKSRLNDIMLRRIAVAYEHQRPYKNPRTGEATNCHVYARIAAVADAFDAMLSPRTWRPPLSTDVALENLQREAGRKFDPVIVKAMFVLGRPARP